MQCPKGIIISALAHKRKLLLLGGDDVTSGPLESCLEFAQFFKNATFHEKVLKSANFEFVFWVSNFQYILIKLAFP